MLLKLSVFRRLRLRGIIVILQLKTTKKLALGKRNVLSLHSLNRIIAIEMKELKIRTNRGVLLDGVLFTAEGGADTMLNAEAFSTARQSDTVLIEITGIHGNFYSSPFYYNIGNTLSAAVINGIEVSANGTSRTGIRAGQNEGYSRAAAMALAACVDTPVVLVGGLRSVEKINQFLNDTNSEYVSLSRPLIREPHLINRWQAGDTPRRSAFRATPVTARPVTSAFST